MRASGGGLSVAALDVTSVTRTHLVDYLVLSITVFILLDFELLIVDHV